MITENLTRLIADSIRKNWNIQSMTDYKGSGYTFSGVAKQIARLHIVFEACGIRPGQKIALIGKNSANWGICYLATITYGAVIVPVLPDFKANDIHHITNHSDAVLMFIADSIFENLHVEKMQALQGVFSLNDFGLLNDMGNQQTADAADSLSKAFDEKYPEEFTAKHVQYPEIPNSDLAVISYTSGTTGFTKGVMIQHNSLAANVVYANNNMPLDPGDAIVSFLPLAHAYGCAFEFLWPFTLGCHITFLTKTPSPQIILQAFREIRPRLVLSVPLVIEKIYKKQILPALGKSSMKVLLKLPLLNKVVHKKVHDKLLQVFGGNFHEIVIGGAPLNKEVETFLHLIRFPFSIGYGMTECGPLISYANWDKTRLGSAGKIVDSLEVKIDSPDPYRIAGEIMVKGENVMLGYYKNEEATAAALDNEGWLHTGDLGMTDKDGFIYIKGRNKSMILGSSGQNIYPEEIEAMFNNKALVQESLVVDKNGVLTALIYPDYESVDKSDIKENQLLEMLEVYKKEINDMMPAYMGVSRVKIVPEEFEKTPKKSIKRFMYTFDD
jgi:long-chain acyl-CoA synthetase